ncbi:MULTISPECIES: hypothetical protein [unclassified Micromonospora]|uniref:hypothetical protein n=1 Tax=unclassified Micromonospora TaxID=2617518 RepID=UPI00332F3909
MARYMFGGGIADYTMILGDTVTVGGFTGHPVVAVGGQPVTFWTAEEGGSQHTDLLDTEAQPVSTVLSEDGTGIRAVGQIPRFSGPDGITTMWAQAGDGPRALMVTTDAADATGDIGTILPPLSVSGPVTTGVGVHRLYNDTTATLLIAGVRASVGTAPTGGSVIVDVNRNGTTIFAAQSERPTIPAGGNTTGKVVPADVTTLVPGDYLTVDVDPDGGGTGAANLVVQILVTKG